MPLALPAVVSVLVKLRRTIDKSKGESLECSSGEPQTHPCLEGATDLVELPLAHSDVFTCKGAVDLPKLLRASRASLFDKAIYSGANVLHKESWHCDIRFPKDTRHHPFRVRIRYTAKASRSSVRDSQQPVALDRVRNVPGLMTILQREEGIP